MHKILLLLAALAGSLSANAQSHWQALPDYGLTGNFGGRLEDVYFTDTTTGYAVSLAGHIFKTRDAGRNWKKVFSKPYDARFRSIEFLGDGKTGVAGTLGLDALYRTEDGGATWANIHSRLPVLSTGNHGIICGLSHWENTFYAVGSYGTRPAKYYKSIDKGLSWSCSLPDSSLITFAVDVCFISRDTGFITGAYNPSGNYLASVVIKTTNGGRTWTRVFMDTTIGGRIWKMQAVSPRHLVGSIEPYYSSDTIAMIRSTDGGESWQIIGTGYNSRSTQAVGFVNEQQGWLGGHYSGLFETKDGGKTWIPVAFGANFNRFFVLDSTHVFAGGAGTYFFGGKLPTPPVTGIRPVPATSHRLHPVSPNPATGMMKVSFELANSTYVQLQVASLDAKKVWDIAGTQLPAGRHVFYWDAAQAPPGNYMVWLGTNEQPFVEKFVVHH